MKLTTPLTILALGVISATSAFRNGVYETYDLTARGHDDFDLELHARNTDADPDYLLEDYLAKREAIDVAIEAILNPRRTCPPHTFVTMTNSQGKKYKHCTNCGGNVGKI